jgi:hypothetical protein
MNLRDAILKELAGSSSQFSIPLETLRKIAEPICDDLVDLYKLLDQMYLDKTIQRASGYKNSKPFVSYWITGAILAPAPFRISTPAPIPRAVLVRKIATPEQAAAKMQPTAAKVQPNTSISPFPQTQEKPMGHPSSEVRTTIYNMIVAKPGMKQTDLIEYVLVECPDSTEKQVRKMIENLIHSSKKVRYEGIRAERTLFPVDETSKPANQPAVAAPPQHVPAPAKTKAVCTGPALDISFHMDGSLYIGRGDQAIALDSKDALRLMQFCSHQLPYADSVSA